MNSDSILIDIDKSHDPYLAWIGHGTIVELDEFNPNKPNIKFNHSYWSSYTIPPDDNIVPQSEVDDWGDAVEEDSSDGEGGFAGQPGFVGFGDY